MGIISRFLLLLYSLAVGAVIVIVGAACLGVMPENYWQPSLKFILAQPETLAVLAVMLLLSLFFLTRVFASNSKTVESVARDEIILQQGQVGEVKVSIDAIQRITERAALTVNGVRESSAVILKGGKGSPITVKLDIVLGQGFAAPTVSENAINAIDKAILVALQLPEVPVEVKVKDITNAVIERRQRVV
ncbi:MAG: alkaline shock response membrane anchor protein AmaP [Selenomonadaceae bacterium]|nr:alkaline shock response membrane anchor protein AmaP [Selenomonadaceae bacterium]